jgi:anti-anti-sigma regulatory factor
LTRIEFMDVKGFAALLNAHRKVHDAHGEMSVVCPPGQVRRMLGLLDTSGRLRLSP